MVTVNHVLTRMLRLAHITSGFVTIDAVYDPLTGEQLGEREINRLDPNPKLEAMVQRLKEMPEGDKAIVWACWRMDLKTIAARLKLEGIDHVTYHGSTSEKDREVAVDRFNNDTRVRVFLGNPDCAGQAVNLLGQASPLHDAVWMHVFSQNWKPATRSQKEKRFHRKGTRRPVQVVDWCVPDSIDEQIRARVMKKRIMATKIQDIRELLTEMQRCLK